MISYKVGKLSVIKEIMKENHQILLKVQKQTHRPDKAVRHHCLRLELVLCI